MHYYEISPSGQVTADKDTLTYACEHELAIGSVVAIPFGKRQTIGVTIKKTTKPSYTTKPVGEIIGQPLPSPLVQLALWLAQHYATPLPLVIQSMLPRGLTKKRRELKSPKPAESKQAITPPLTAEQETAIGHLQKNTGKAMILHGVTGSGKTRIYIETAKAMADKGASSIILVPEIGLTSQTIANFSTEFPNAIVTHSQMTESQRHQAWTKLQQTEGPVVVIGPRSALFSPLTNIGLVVVDEFHEQSYKQDQAPKYNAVHAAATLAALHKATLLLGSATPDVATRYIFEEKNLPIITLRTPAVKAARTPRIQTVNLADKSIVKVKSWLSKELKDSISEVLDEEGQVLIFHNRRGTAPLSLCTSCGWIAECPTCTLPFTLHADFGELRCHICNKKNPVPSSCPECHEPELTFQGFGTKQIEHDLNKLFPAARVQRFDADVSKKDSLAARYDAVRRGDVDILVGTQMLAKGLDLPKLQLVGIALADTSLFLPDYTASERTFQLISQASGRVGRHDAPSTVLIQSYNPDHPAIKTATTKNYQQFYEYEIEQRKMLKYPPFAYLLQLTIDYATRNRAIDACLELQKQLQTHFRAIEVLGPAPAFHERLNNRYRWQLVVKTRQRSTLVDICRSLPDRWTINLDPINLL